MADNRKKEKNNGNGGAKVIPMICQSTGCKERPKRANFCNEHFIWYKEGLITTEGVRAKDFDKKYQHFLRRQKAA